MKPGEDYFPYRQRADAFMATDDGQWAIHHLCSFPVWCYVGKSGTLPRVEDLDRIAVHTANRERRLCELAKIPSIGALGDSAKAYLATLESREADIARLFTL